MANKYKKNYCLISYIDSACEALICFTEKNIPDIETFRESILKQINVKDRYIMHIEYGLYPEIDTYCDMFHKADNDVMNRFNSARMPNMFSKIFKTKYYHEYVSLREEYTSKRQFAIMTSHDDPSIEFYTRQHSVNEMRSLIGKTATMMKIKIEYINSIDEIMAN